MMRGRRQAFTRRVSGERRMLSGRIRFVAPLLVAFAAFMTIFLVAPGCQGDNKFGQPQGSLLPEERTRRRQEDLTVLVDSLATKHKNPFFKITREEFDAAAADLRLRIWELPDWQFVIELQILAAMLGDSHTAIQFGGPIPNTRNYPIRLVWLKDGLFVTATDPAHKDLLRSRLVRIGAFGVEEAAESVARIAAVENRASFERAAMSRLTVAEFLKVCRVIVDMESVPFTFARSDGTERTVTLSPLVEGSEPEWSWAPDEALTTLPISRRGRNKPFGFEFLPEHHALYLWYDRCENAQEMSVAAWAREVLAFVDANDVRRLIIDLRRNRGGNSMLLWPLTGGLGTRPRFSEPGRQIVLIGRGTISSGELNAEELKMYNKAVLIGSPTGQRPNAYGEVRTFKLPHSKLSVGYSTKYFKRTDDNVESLMPDVSVDETSADYFAGRDPALEAALLYAP